MFSRYVNLKIYVCQIDLRPIRYKIKKFRDVLNIKLKGFKFRNLFDIKNEILKIVSTF